MLVTLFPFAAVIVLVSLFSGASAVTFSWLMVKKVFGKGDRLPTPILGFLVLQLGAFVAMFLVAMLEAVPCPLFQRLLPWALSHDLRPALSRRERQYYPDLCPQGEKIPATWLGIGIRRPRCAQIPRLGGAEKNISTTGPLVTWKA